MKETQASEIAFFGKITASFTHEMKNVLATIKETSGLLEDLLAMGPKDSFPHRERFVRALSSVQEQVRRGVELSSRLNRFAHSPDKPVATIDLNEEVAQVALLSQRFARNKRVELKAIPAKAPLLLTTSSVRLQMALFAALECCWNEMPAGGEVCMGVERRGDEACVGLQCRKAGENPEELSPQLKNSPQGQALLDAVGSLGGRLEAGDSEFALAVVLPVEA